MNTESSTHSRDELLTVASGWLVGGGLITMVLFPLAIPILALTAIAVLPFVLIPLAVALAVAVVAVPFLLVLRLGRSAKRALRPTRTAEQGGPESRSGPAGFAPARGSRS
jgi:Flp pilus assembly protein TadB